MGFARVVAWIAGILGCISFFFSLGMPKLIAGEYLIVALIVVAMSLYFGRQDKKKVKIESEPTTTPE